MAATAGWRRVGDAQNLVRVERVVLQQCVGERIKLGAIGLEKFHCLREALV